MPDAFVRAGEIRLVDLAPSALRQRLAQGLVVPAERVDTALSSYFRFANLAALRGPISIPYSNRQSRSPSTSMSCLPA